MYPMLIPLYIYAKIIRFYAGNCILPNYNKDTDTSTIEIIKTKGRMGCLQHVWFVPCNVLLPHVHSAYDKILSIAERMIYKATSI